MPLIFDKGGVSILNPALILLVSIRNVSAVAVNESNDKIVR